MSEPGQRGGGVPPRTLGAAARRWHLDGVIPLGAIAMLAAAPVAFAIQRVNAGLPDRPERAASVVAGLFLLLVLLPVGFTLLRRRDVTPGTLGLITVAVMLVLLVASYLYW